MARPGLAYLGPAWPGSQPEAGPSTPLCPTHCEVLQAASIINKYIDTLHDPLACRLEGVLASFRCQMWLEMSHSVKSTHLTDYFHCA